MLSGTDISYIAHERWPKRTVNWSLEVRKKKTRNEVGKRSDKSDEAEDSNNLKLNEPANIARRELESVTGIIILENSGRHMYV